MYNERKHDNMNGNRKNDKRYQKPAEVFQPNARESGIKSQEIDKAKILQIPKTYQQSPTTRTVLMITNNALSVMVNGGAESPMLPISCLKNLEPFEYNIQSSNHMVKLVGETIILCLDYVKLKVLFLETMKKCELNFILLQEGEPSITNIIARQLRININEKVDEIMGDRQENLKMLNYFEECASLLHRVIIENEDIFNEVQVEPAVEIEIPLKEGFEPVIRQPYKLNQSQLEVLRKELNKQILLGHTYSVKNPIHCSPITITSDNRVCIDSRKQIVMTIETELELSSIRDIQLLLKSSSSNSNVISQIDLA
uniref:Reverse transcriptase domain-containing protein n=1 Tax=Strongyloides venezuelensis TaxID=75913 RepID=A0A0K0FPM6_STRVS